MDQAIYPRIKKTVFASCSAIAIASSVLLTSPAAWAVHKCVANNKTNYQELPCEQNTVAQDLIQKDANELLHRRLDGLLASGVGVNSRADQKRAERAKAPAAPSAESPPPEDQQFQSQPRTRANREAKQALTSKNAYLNALESNAKASERMQKDYDGMLVLCNGKTFKHPVVGMTDEQFRMCTLPNRLGAIEKVVVAEDRGTALRLYVSPTQPATRVYTIGGVVTAVKP
jgi:hypothetical protein